MAGVSTIGTSGYYATIAAWETAVNASSLTGVEEGLLLGEEHEGRVSFLGGVTTSSDYLHLSVVDGADFDMSTRTGARIVAADVTGWGPCVWFGDPYHRIGGATPSGQSSAAGRIGISITYAAGDTNTAQGLLFDAAGGCIADALCIYGIRGHGDVNAVNSGSKDVPEPNIIKNSVIFDVESDGSAAEVRGIREFAADSVRVQYCTIDNVRSTAPDSGAVYGVINPDVTVNSWVSRLFSASGATTRSFVNYATLDSCASDDTYASQGLQNLDPAAQFVSLTAGAEDYHLLATSALIGAANDAYGVLVDIDGPTTARTDIGADEYQDAGGGPTLVSAADGGALSASGVAGVSGVVTATDAATAALADGAGINGTIAAGDVAGLTVADAPELLALVASADGSTLSTTELVDLAAAIGVSDGAALSLLDGVALLSVVVSLADAASVSATEAAAAISGTVSAADDALVALADAASVYLPLASSDGATLAVADAARGIALAMQMSDALSVSVADAATVAALLARSDSAAVALADLAAITGTVSAADAAAITAAEQARINGVLTALDAVAATVTDEAQRQAIGRIVARLVGRWRIYPTLRAEQIGVSDGPSDR